MRWQRLTRKWSISPSRNSERVSAGFQRPYAVESMAERVGFKLDDFAYVTCLQQDTSETLVNTGCCSLANSRSEYQLLSSVSVFEPYFGHHGHQGEGIRNASGAPFQPCALTRLTLQCCSQSFRIPNTGVDICTQTLGGLTDSAHHLVFSAGLS